MSILLAIAEPSISNALRKLLVEYGLPVIEEEVLHRKYLNETIELSSPSMVIIHDLYLPSELEDKEERDLEMLQLIEYWRSIYDSELRVVYLCIRERHDPFISQLAARNVLDIFHEQSLSTEKFIEQVKQPPRFVNVQKFGTGNLNIEFLDEEKVEDSELEGPGSSNENEGEPKVSLFEKATQLGTNLAGGAIRGAAGLKDKIPKREVTERLARQPSPPKEKKKSKSNEAMMEDILDLMPIDATTIQIKPSIIGTVLVAVAGVKAHLGTTHTALSIASFLRRLGNSVAIVEVNYSEDFERIHSLYEGERRLLKKDNYFDIYGIDHYKYRENLDLNHLYSAYEYVIMDYGELDELDSLDIEVGYVRDFKRAHIRCVVCSGDEWKFHWIHEFLQHNNLDKKDCTFIVPCGTKAKIEDLQERLDYLDVYAIPTQESPYEPLKETEDILLDILGTYIKSPQRSFSKKTLIATSVISIAITALLLTIFNFLG